MKRLDIVKNDSLKKIHDRKTNYRSNRGQEHLKDFKQVITSLYGVISTWL